MFSKGQIEKIVQELKAFDNPDINKEQYFTAPDVAAEVINQVNLNHDIEDKVVVDMGAGTGFLTIGALISGAKKIYFVDSDENALKILKDNIVSVIENYDVELGDYRLINKDIKDITISTFPEKIDVVIMNPPFGTREKHMDTVFLEKAFELADTVYSLHKTSTKPYIVRKGQEHGYDVKTIELRYRLKRQYDVHTKKFKDIGVTLFIFNKNG